MKKINAVNNLSPKQKELIKFLGTALFAFDKGDFKRAEQIFKILQNADSDVFNTRAVLAHWFEMSAQRLLNKGYKTAAIKCFKRSIQEIPSPATYFQLCSALVAVGKTKVLTDVLTEYLHRISTKKEPGLNKVMARLYSEERKSSRNIKK